MILYIFNNKSNFNFIKNINSFIITYKRIFVLNNRNNLIRVNGRYLILNFNEIYCIRLLEFNFYLQKGVLCMQKFKIFIFAYKMKFAKKLLKII